MKRLNLSVILLVLITLRAIGQDFGAVGTQWYYSGNALGACPGNCEYIHLESVADTTINGKTTHKILHTLYKMSGDSIALNALYVYEEADTVFMWSFTKARFLTTFIFNGSIGDTLTLDAPYEDEWLDSVYRLVIDTVITTVIDGVPLKKYRTTPLDDFFFSYEGDFMDRIGGLGLFFPLGGAFILEIDGPIRCYSDAEVDTSFQSIACDYVLLTSVDDLPGKSDVVAFPNPTTGPLTLSSEQTITQVDVFDANGRRVATSTRPTLDLSDLPNGQYLLSIHLVDGRQEEGQVLKVDP